MRDGRVVNSLPLGCKHRQAASIMWLGMEGCGFWDTVLVPVQVG